MNAIFVEGKPDAKPRMTRSDKWKRRPSVIRYRDFADRVRMARDLQLKPYSFKPSNAMLMFFFFPVPTSWSKKKKLAHLWKAHTSRPDTDNLVKAVLDSLFEEDAEINQVFAQKLWAPEEGTLILSKEYEDEPVHFSWTIGKGPRISHLTERDKNLQLFTSCKIQEQEQRYDLGAVQIIWSPCREYRQVLYEGRLNSCRGELFERQVYRERWGGERMERVLGRELGIPGFTEEPEPRSDRSLEF